jgi:hypothetical protein
MAGRPGQAARSLPAVIRIGGQFSSSGPGQILITAQHRETVAFFQTVELPGRYAGVRRLFSAAWT